MEQIQMLDQVQIFELSGAESDGVDQGAEVGICIPSPDGFTVCE